MPGVFCHHLTGDYSVNTCMIHYSVYHNYNDQTRVVTNQPDNCMVLVTLLLKIYLADSTVWPDNWTVAVHCDAEI
jgi:hypothetical protein